MPEPRKTKQTGYMVEVECFVPSDMTRIQTLTDLQKVAVKIQEDLPGAHVSITPCRR